MAHSGHFFEQLLIFADRRRTADNTDWWGFSLKLGATDDMNVSLCSRIIFRWSFDGQDLEHGLHRCYGFSRILFWWSLCSDTTMDHR